MSEENTQTRKYQIKRISQGKQSMLGDNIAIEAPLEIRIKREKDPMSKAVAVTMRTPGMDEALALGFLFTEGIIKNADQFVSSKKKEDNIIELTVSNDTNTDLKNADRNFYTTSSCGVCGKASIESIKVQPEFEVTEDFELSSDLIYSLNDKVKGAQEAFDLTGGIHASTLFNLEGELLDICEDVGRHNALDKLVGKALKLNKLPLRRTILLLSGRASFELIQKAAMAGIPLIVAIGAPSSLAIDMAQEHSLTLIGFLKKDRFNIYSGHERIKN